MVNAVAPSVSVAASYSSTLIAKCPDGVLLGQLPDRFFQGGAGAYPCLGRPYFRCFSPGFGWPACLLCSAGPGWRAISRQTPRP
eukprot:2460681-Pyramimonas_sp.AAC.1